MLQSVTTNHQTQVPLSSPQLPQRMRQEVSGGAGQARAPARSLPERLIAALTGRIVAMPPLAPPRAPALLAATATLIPMRERAGADNCAINTTLLKIARRVGDAGKGAVYASSACRDVDGVWRHDSGAALHGQFIFVTMADGEIRLGAPIQGVNAHAKVSGAAMHVRYAGEVSFDAGRVTSYNNVSGTYWPQPELFAQAGFGTDAPFSACSA